MGLSISIYIMHTLFTGSWFSHFPSFLFLFLSIYRPISSSSCFYPECNLFFLPKVYPIGWTFSFFHYALFSCPMPLSVCLCCCCSHSHTCCYSSVTVCLTGLSPMCAGIWELSLTFATCGLVKVVLRYFQAPQPFILSHQEGLKGCGAQIPAGKTSAKMWLKW